MPVSLYQSLSQDHDEGDDSDYEVSYRSGHSKSNTVSEEHQGLLSGVEASTSSQSMNDDTHWGDEIQDDPCFFILLLCAGYLQGTMGLSMLTLAFLYKDDLLFSPTQVAFCTSISSIPWLLKPLWGVLSDAIPILGYRRRPYLFIGCKSLYSSIQ